LKKKNEKRKSAPILTGKPGGRPNSRNSTMVFTNTELALRGLSTVSSWSSFSGKSSELHTLDL